MKGGERRDWGDSASKKSLHEMAGFVLRRISPRSVILGHQPCPIYICPQDAHIAP